MFRTLATSTVALIAGAAPLFADVTPAQVWDNLAKYYDKVGYEVVVGNRDDSGQTLTLSDVVVKTAQSEDYALVVTMPKVTLQQTGDAKVRTVFDQDITADFTGTLPEGAEGEGDGKTSFTMDFAMPGNQMLSSGTPDEMLHELNYPSIVMTLNIPEPQAAGNPNPVTVTLTDLTGTQTTKVSGGTESVYDMAAASLGIAMSATSPDDGEGSGALTSEITMSDLAMSGSMITPEGKVDLTNDMAAALNAGMKADGRFAMGTTTGHFDFTGTGEDGAPRNGAGSFTAESGELSFAMSGEGITYEGKSGATQAEMTVPDLPFPLSYAVEGVTGAVTIPVSKSDQPQDFKLAYEIAGLTLADGIWDLFDQGRQLPRDPANLKIDLEGDALLSQDLLDPALAQTLEQQAQENPGTPPNPQEAMPFLPQTVKINRIALDAVGASADISGQLDLSQNPQEPVGEINGSFTGINGLLDKLIAMGLVPQEQAMGMRMMLAMFAKPVEGNADQLESKLEFREGGSIFANGQQVK